MKGMLPPLRLNELLDGLFTLQSLRARSHALIPFQIVSSVQWVASSSPEF